MLADRVGIDGLAIRCQAHQLVFAVVHLKAAVGGEGRVQQAQRMRKREVMRQADAISLARRPSCVVLHSPTPSSVRMAASSNGLGKNALAAWLS